MNINAFDDFPIHRLELLIEYDWRDNALHTYLTSPSDTESANGGTLIISNKEPVECMNLDGCIDRMFAL